MSEAENRRMLARYVAEVWDAADPEAVRIFAGPGYRRHTSGSSGRWASMRRCSVWSPSGPRSPT